MSESPAPAPDPAAMLAVAIEVGSSLQKFRSLIVAVYTIQVWEWLINFSDEYLYVHKARWSSVKVAFLYCRYFPLLCWPYMIWGWVGDHPRSDCLKVADSLMILLPFCALPPVLVFIIRAYAFTGRHKIILAILMSGWIALFVGYLYRQVHDYTNPMTIMELQALFGHDSACIAMMRDAELVAHDWFPLVIYSICHLMFDSVVAAVVFFHCIRFRTLWGPLGKTFVLQTLMAYVVLVAVQLIFMLAMKSADIQWDGLFTLADIIPNVIACRLILMLRQQGNPSATTEDRLHSEMIRDAIAILPTKVTDDDTDEDSNQVIEKWD